MLIPLTRLSSTLMTSCANPKLVCWSVQESRPCQVLSVFQPRQFLTKLSVKAGHSLKSSKSLHSAMPPAVVVAVVGVGVKAEVVSVGVEVEVEVLEIAKVRTVRMVKIKVRARTRTSILATRLNVIQIHLHSRPVSVTGPLGRVHIFVWNQGPVHGRTSLSQSQINEVLTNSTEMT